MKSSSSPTLQISYPGDRRWRDRQPSRYALKWRQNQLLVSLAKDDKQRYLPDLDDERSLAECLQHSPVRLVRIDPRLGETKLRLWADACWQAHKPVFLRLPTTSELPGKRNPLSWSLKRLFDWCMAAILLLVFSPVMLGLVLLMRRDSAGPILSWQWRVGERGKLFRILKFRTTAEKEDGVVAIAPLARWMLKYNLDKLPQLFNVLRGEMSLVGPRPYNLHDAARIGPEGLRRLNALPGIAGDWLVQARANWRDLEALNYRDLEYLRSWSLWQDLKILPLTMIKVFSSFSAY
ncbi:sugar transferase [Planktothrix sp. FACHB-1355]|uniref:Sugar transferase n=1 Tax=Aerosakkonema funiforme FACHB-1375 TaxID=2949571 RepID=A0A926VN12_9CYAN|nr:MULTISPECIES: heterocyst development glycosyltransferase HepC [Oscillatoriales]MBD2186213.1 sugar transferase [Aerosakkonema funiforme FACHB-1375]MBD3561854.1 sugar transferase [Planktothrix sp. FACHB-1355]